MKVLFLTLYPDTAASPRYRVAQFLPHLREAGMDCTVASPLTAAQWKRCTGPDRQGRAFWYHFHETPRRLVQLCTAGKYDVVFLQKSIMSAYLRGLPLLLRQRARRLVYDLDDALHLSPPHPLRPPWSLLEDAGQIERIMAKADLVLAGNDWIRQRARETGARSEFFPTVVDTDRFTPPDMPPRDFCIGWIGSPGTTSHLDLLRDELASQEQCKILLVGADPKKVHLSAGEIRHWDYDMEVETVRQFSVGIMPQPKDTWTRGKCALKALLYMACGVPCVATPHGAVLDIICHGENGYFADTPDEWHKAINLMRDPVLRERIGAAARATVEKRFSLRVAAPKLQHYLEALV
jgi:glycosyltransferase involved in cell wall biosynthesis